jgi:CoA:oxalate CoA-transferase
MHEDKYYESPRPLQADWKMQKILEDIKVLDFTHVWFGPYCTMMLAGLGAQVITVEPPWGNIGRLGPGELYKGTSTSFMAVNCGKKGVAIDMKKVEGISLIKELVKECDVVIQNFAPGVMERLGLGYEELKKIKPGIIYAALSGFGQYGPYSRYGSYAVVAEAISGYTYATGKGVSPDHASVTMAGALGDIGPGTFAAFAIVSAIRYRDKTGKGQMIDINQADTMVSFNLCETVAYDLFKESPIERRRKRTPPPGEIWGVLKVKDGWVQIAGSRPKAIEEMKQRLGVEEVTVDLIQKMIEGMTRKEAFEWLVSFDVPSAPIYEAYEGFDDPHLIARKTFVVVPHPIAGSYRIPKFPAEFSETPGEIETGAIVLGQHTEEVLKTILKKTSEEIQKLEQEGVITIWRP